MTRLRILPLLLFTASIAAPALGDPVVPAPGAAPTAAYMQSQIRAAQVALARANERLAATKTATEKRLHASADPAAPRLASVSQTPPCPLVAQARPSHRYRPASAAARVNALARELAQAKSQLALFQHTHDAVQDATDATYIGAKSLFAYSPDMVYHINTAIGHETNIELEPGEVITGSSKLPLTGDSTRWTADTTTAGSPPNQVTIVVVKPLWPGINTNMLITTNKHIYNITVSSGDSVDSPYMPVVGWTYPFDEQKAQMKLAAEKTRETASRERIAVDPAHLAFAYAIHGDDYPWKPLRVFDDGTKTYIEMSPLMKSYDAPALFVMSSDNTPFLVNYRVKGNYYIVDRLFRKAQLRIGKESVDIVNKDAPHTAHSTAPWSTHHSPFFTNS
ncbi:MAG: P-type conjugative transfer protein TrbG [Betaproteobacteria bacterium]|nr:P-type conjugative transfer protein TrbG [Betaproteobacteria bacterium]